MSDYPVSPQRPWKEIAAELCREFDRGRVLALSIELDAALQAQTNVHASAPAKITQSDERPEHSGKEST